MAGLKVASLKERNGSDLTVLVALVSQGLLFGPLLFTLHVNNLGQNVPNAQFNFYADNKIIHYCVDPFAPSLVYLWSVFCIVESLFCDAILVSNGPKSKLMLFSNARKAFIFLSCSVTVQDSQTELQSQCNYLHILNEKC